MLFVCRERGTLQSQTHWDWLWIRLSIRAWRWSRKIDEEQRKGDKLKDLEIGGKLPIKAFQSYVAIDCKGVSIIIKRIRFMTHCLAVHGLISILVWPMILQYDASRNVRRGRWQRYLTHAFVRPTPFLYGDVFWHDSLWLVWHHWMMNTLLETSGVVYFSKLFFGF